MRIRVLVDEQANQDYDPLSASSLKSAASYNKNVSQLDCNVLRSSLPPFHP